MRPFQAVLIRLPAPLIAGTLWFLSSQSGLPQPPGPLLGWDKFQHLTAYAILGFSVGLWITPALWARRPLAILLTVAAIGSLYGAIDEIHQYFVPGRDSCFWDWVANTLGSFLGALATMLVMRRLKRPDPPSAENSIDTPTA